MLGQRAEAGHRFIKLVIFGLLLLFWTALTLPSDWYACRNIYAQEAARSYQSVVGRILPRLPRAAASAPAVGFPRIPYSYTVGGKTFYGSRYWWDTEDHVNRWEENVKKRYPAGTPVRVYYDPYHPRQAVLSVGVDGSDLLMLLILTPFNIVMAAGWIAVITILRRQFSHRVILPFRAVDTASGTVLRRSNFWIPIASGSTVAIAAILTALPQCLLFDWRPPLLLAESCLLTVVICGAIGGYFAWRFVRRQSRAIVIDDRQQVIFLPPSVNRGRRRIALGSIARVQVAVHAAPGPASEMFDVVLVYTTGSGAASATLYSGSSAVLADSLADYLRVRLGLLGGQQPVHLDNLPSLVPVDPV